VSENKEDSHSRDTAGKVGHVPTIKMGQILFRSFERSWEKKLKMRKRKEDLKEGDHYIHG